jgi:hypothetical protein
MTNTVCILTNFRTGSTAFTLLKSEQYNLPYKGELFSHERPWDYGPALAAFKELENIRDGIVPPDEYSKLGQRDFKQIYKDELKKGTPACFKLMPDHVVQPWLKNIDPEHDLEIAQSCDKVYVLYRRNWADQVKSWVGMRANGEFGKNGLKHDRKSGDPRLVDFHWNMHVGTEYQVERVVRDINIRDWEFAKLCTGQLMNNYKRLAYLYKQLPNAELVCMEDFYATQPYKKYNHEFVWSNGEPEIPDFDVEGLFT